jgi:fructose-1,6-bisphosphatase I
MPETTAPPHGLVLSHHLRQERAAHPDFGEPLAALLTEIALAGKVISREVTRAGLTGRTGYTGETNVQGEAVKQLDQWSNIAMVSVLEESGLACTLVSEEMEEPLHVGAACRPGSFAVCFDPVDGSSNTDINGIVGTIFGVRATRPGAGAAAHLAEALGPGTAQVAAGYIMYGPASLFVYTAGHGVHGLTLDTTTGEYLLTHPNLRMPSRGKTYAVNEANWDRWGPGPREFIRALRAETTEPHYSLRYVGSLVADIHRIVLEGGIYFYPPETGGKRPGGKLRLLYEAAPLGFLAEQAGGRASTGTERILDIVPEHHHQRVPLYIGSAEEVGRAESFCRAKNA